MHFKLRPVAAALCTLISLPAIAQTETTQGFQLEEVTVTAHKREESLQTVPTAVSAFSSEQLTAQNISNVDDLGKYIPNLNISRYGVGNTAHASIFIRGIGLQDHIITTDPGVGVYLDGVYLGRQMGANLGLTNIERVEVLRGPQGTLYGRNTLGGAVNIITKRAGSEEATTVTTKMGTRGRVAADLYASTKLADNLGLSISSSITRRDGVGKAVNIANPEAEIGEEFEASGRISLAWDFAANHSLLLAADGVQNESGQSPYTIEFTTPLDPNDIFLGDFPMLDASYLPSNPDDSGSGVAGLESTSFSGYGVSATWDWELSDNLASKVISAYRDSEYTGGLDDDGTILDLSQFPEEGYAEQSSLEWQLNASFGDFDIVGGLYYFEEEGATISANWVFSPWNTPDSQMHDGSPSFGGLGYFDLNQSSESTAAYANIKYQLTENLRIGGGIRYSKDDKTADALFPSFGGQRKTVNASYDAMTWDLNIGYALSDDLNVYGAIQSGYKPGGLPPRPFGGPANFIASNETTATNYELGLKGQFGDSLDLSVALFSTEYEDLNLPISDTSGVGFETGLAFNNKSEAKGVEVESTLIVTDNFRINASVGYIKAEITEVLGGISGVSTNIVAGDTPALTPEWTYSIVPEYMMQFGSGLLTLSMDYSFRDEMYGQSVNNPYELMSDRALLGFTAQYLSANEDWSLALYGKNVTNEVYDAGRLAQTGFVGVVRSNDRSEFGLIFTKHFN